MRGPTSQSPASEEAGSSAAKGPASSGAFRCTLRKHVVENGRWVCDCKAVVIAPTAQGNATVVSVLVSSLAAAHNLDELGPAPYTDDPAYLS